MKMNDETPRVERAAEAAYTAFRQYSCCPGAKRAQLLRQVADGIEQLGDTLIQCVRRETSLPEPRLVSERARTCTQLRLFATLAEEGSWVDERVDLPDPSRQPVPKPRVRSLLRPLGPVAIFGASNFPLAFSVAGGDTAAALAVGCTVVFKAHPAHPDTSRLVSEVIRSSVVKSGLPESVFSLLDLDNEAAQSLVKHPYVKAGAFTGSLRGGLALLRAAQSRPDPIPFFAEMGSVNPVFIFPSAIQKQAQSLATGLHTSMTASLGQLCTQPGLIFLLDTTESRGFLDALAALFTQTSAGKMLTAPIQSAYRDAIERRRTASHVEEVARSGDADGAPAVLHVTDAETFLSAEHLHEEVFGPASLAVLCRSLEDFVRCAESLGGQLTATVWSNSEEFAGQDDLRWMLEQKAGRIIFNGFPTGVELGAAMVHGGPFPASTDSRFTSVGTRSIYRFVRAVAWQTPT